MFVRRLAVELMLVAQPGANLDSPPELASRAADGLDSWGEVEPSDLTSDIVKDRLRAIYLKGKQLVNVCTNRIPVVIRGRHGPTTAALTFKAALAQGKGTARQWFSKAVGPSTDNSGKPIGLNQAGRTRLRSDLKRGLISRREATFLGIQSALVVATKFAVLQLPEWDGFRHLLFKDCYECSCISTFGKRWKNFTTAIQNSLLGNLLMERPRAQLEEIVDKFPTAKRVAELLLRLGVPILTGPKGNRERLWLVAHLTQSRFLPGPSRKECLSSVVELKDRLTGPRPDGTQWVTAADQFASVELACQTVGLENRESRYAKDVTRSHLSLSNSACLEYTRKEGGKLSILWGDFKEFMESKISDHFKIALKEDEELFRMQGFLATVQRSVAQYSRKRPSPEVESPMEIYTRGRFLHRARLLKRIQDAPMGRIPNGISQKDLYNLYHPELPEVFQEHSLLAAYLPSGFPMSNVEEAYRIARINLESRIERKRKEQTGVFDAIGNEVCPAQYIDLPIWQAAYLSEPLEASAFREPLPLVDADGDKILDLRAGVDSRFGMLLFLWSEVKYREWTANGRLPLPVDPVPISEPGVKARIATKSLIWINLYLSPASHLIKETMLSIPGCRTGLKGSDHAWNFEASFGRHASSWRKIEAISTSDLTAATDWLEHDIAARAMKAFLAGRFDEHPATGYLDNAIDLVCSPRLLIEKPSCFKLKGGTRNMNIYRRYKTGPAVSVSHSGTYYRGYVTNRAVLMGEPLTKMILSLLSIAAERAARASTTTLNPSIADYRQTRRTLHQYACAGDDHIGIGRVTYLKQIPQVLQYWSGEISWDKYCVSRYGAHYCQDFIIKPEPGPRYALRALSKLARQGRKEDKPKYKLDHVWLRLFSDRRKVGSAVFEETNPFPGKAKALTESMSWAGWGIDFNINLLLLQKLGLGRWFPTEYLKDARSYVPQAFGGRGLMTLPGIELALPDYLRYCITNSDNVAVRMANGSGDSRKLRGVILDDTDKALKRLQELGVRVYTQVEVEEDAAADDLERFGEVSRTSLQGKISQDFVDYEKFDLTEKKVAVIAKAFNGPSVLTETQKSYEGRMRSVARAQRRIHIANNAELVPAPMVQVALMQPWAAIRRLYVRRTDLDGLLPIGVIPSFTIPVTHLSGSMSLIEMEGRVLPQRDEMPDVLAQTELDSMSVVSSYDDTSLLNY